MMNLDDVREGMVLGADVTTPTGRLLLRAGTVLTDKHIRLLAANGVTGLDIGERPPTAARPTRRRMTADEIDSHLLRRFGHHDAGHPLVSELKRICRDRLNRPELGGETDAD